MKSIHIRDVDERVLHKLRKSARLHHRSLQGELRAILETAAERIPDEPVPDALNLHTAESNTRATWSREEIYSDDAR